MESFFYVYSLAPKNDDLCVFPAAPGSAVRQVAKFGFAWRAFSYNSLGNQQPAIFESKQVYGRGEQFQMKRYTPTIRMQEI